jgi:hypothetical protein
MMASYILGITMGMGGARLSHKHERQYTYVLQSMMLWREVGGVKQHCHVDTATTRRGFFLLFSYNHRTTINNHTPGVKMNLASRSEEAPPGRHLQSTVDIHYREYTDPRGLLRCPLGLLLCNATQGLHAKVSGVFVLFFLPLPPPRPKRERFSQDLPPPPRLGIINDEEQTNTNELFL